jgi:phage terminase small subunit
VTDQATLQTTFDTALGELKGKERKLVVEYLHDLHQRNAAIRAGYSARTADVQASQILRKLKVRAAINAGMALYAMPAPEVLYRLAEHAQATADDFLTIERVMRHEMIIEPAPTEEEPQAVKIVPGPDYEVIETHLDLAKAKDRGKLHLLKEYKVDKDGAISVKWHDPQIALIAIGKAHRLFVDRTELTGKDGAPIVMVSAEDLAAARLKALTWEAAQDG